MKKYFLILLFAFSLGSFGKINVITTTTNLKSLVELLGGDRVSVSSLCLGAQDPHFLQAKPSFMLKLSRADLLFSVGLELESAWLPLVVRGGRNPKLRPGGSGSLEVGSQIPAIERPTEEVTRADGDIHPSGNPHFMLDPLLAKKVSRSITEKLIETLPKDKVFFLKNLQKAHSLLDQKIKEIKTKLQESHKVITYHRTLSYFYKRFKITNIAFLEPKPGVPPTAKHILNVMKQAKEENVKVILVENYFDTAIAKKVSSKFENIKIISIPVAVNGSSEIHNLFELYDKISNAVLGKN